FSLRGREHHRVALADEHGAVGLLGQLAGLECDLSTRDLHRQGGRALRCNAHLSSTSFGRWRFESAHFFDGLAQTSTLGCGLPLTRASSNPDPGFVHLYLLSPSSWIRVR